MKKKNLVLLGSQTARNGFKNERDIATKFKNWLSDEEAKLWLRIMGYKLEKIRNVDALIVTREKTDVQVQINIDMQDLIARENLQVKLVSNSSGFNQIDKRWIDTYTELWSIPKTVQVLLKQFTGEISPTLKKPKDSRRTFLDEFSHAKQNEIIDFFSSNKPLIVNDILRGRGLLAAEWILVAQKISTDARWVLVPMNIAINHFSTGPVVLSPRGSLKIGRITMQRKGGDGGRTSSNMLQFKIDPAELFNL